ncbi:MAG: alpha/beta hydrolase [Myxococcota bacterium]
MPTIDSNGVWIRFEQYGEPTAPTVLLVHGFASSADDNWVQTGWVRALTKAGRRVVALDCRGHGQSGKPHDPEAYGHDKLAGDLEEVLRYANARTVDVFGYSMGSFLTLHLLERKPGRVRSAILGGVGAGMLKRRPGRAAIAAALVAKDASSVVDPAARAFRVFAEGRGNDLRALAAVQRAESAPPDLEVLGRLTLPMLVVTGAKDTLVGDPDQLAQALPGARAELVPDADHLTAVSHPRMKEIVLGFLAQVDAAAKR